MARKTSARVVLNRDNANRVRLALADGLLAVGQAIVDAAHPPDAEPFGVGLVTQGGAVGYIDGRKIGGQGQKPGNLRLPKPGIVAFAGFGFPARFQEMGTIRQPARPFLTPAMEQVREEAGAIMRDAASAIRGRR